MILSNDNQCRKELVPVICAIYVDFVVDFQIAEIFRGSFRRLHKFRTGIDLHGRIGCLSRVIGHLQQYRLACVVDKTRFLRI